MLAASQGIALAQSNRLLSDQSEMESKPGRFCTKLFLFFVGLVWCSIFTRNSLAYPFLLILDGFNTTVYTDFSWPLGQLCQVRSMCFGTG